MRYTRTPLTANEPFELSAVKLHARIDHYDEDALIDVMAEAAVSEIETRADLAIMAQRVSFDLEAWGCAIILPVGPLLTVADEPVTVTAYKADGTPVPQLNGWWVQTGLRPILRFTARPPGVLLTVSYCAGFGDKPADVPADLRMAIMDQAAKSFDMRGDTTRQPGLSDHAARIVARYKQIRL